MKKKVFILLVLWLLTFSTPFLLFAMTPFGGKIVTIKTPPNVQCGISIASPFNISPINTSSLPGPWSTLPGRVNIGVITPNAWILGMMSTIPGACVTTTTPPVPFPTTVTDFYGTSAGL